MSDSGVGALNDRQPRLGDWICSFTGLDSRSCLNKRSAKRSEIECTLYLDSRNSQNSTGLMNDKSLIENPAFIVTRDCPKLATLCILGIPPAWALDR